MILTKQDIRVIWKDIKDAVAKTIHPAENAEEVYHLCRTGQAHIFTGPEGFIVLQENVNNGIKTLHIWVAYAKGANILEKYMGELEQIAKEIGAKEISFNSQRRGWERRLPEEWYVNYVEYRKKVI